MNNPRNPLAKTARSLFIVVITLLTVLQPESLCAQAAREHARYRVAVCDWMILKRQKLGSFQLAKDISADGVEVDMGGLGQRWTFDNRFHEPAEGEHFRRTADSLGICVPSIAMSGFFAQNFIRRSNYMVPVADCLHTMDVFGATVAFLPLGGSGTDWQRSGTADRRELVRRLHAVGEMARAQGKVIAIRTALNAADDIRLLKEIGSEGIKIYYNLQDAVDQGRNPAAEILKLGSSRIAQIHASLTDSVTLDRDPRIDMTAVRRALDRIDYSGWLVVERSRDAGDVRNVKGNFGTNVAYLKEIFK